MLVDSGATFSVAPTSVLKQLGIKPIRKQIFLLANGEEIEKSIGEAKFSLGKEEWTAPVVFGNETVWLLGAITLEHMGLILDPINRKLLTLPMTI